MSERTRGDERAFRARRWSAGVALLAGLILGGCGEGSGSVPEGWRVNEMRFFSVASPPGWTVETRPSVQASASEPVLEAVGRPGTAGLQPQVVVGSGPWGQSFGSLVDFNETGTQVETPGARRVRREEIDVPGAESALLNVYELRNQAPGQPTDGALVREYELVALSEDGTAVNLFLRLPAADVERVRPEQLIGTLRLE